MWIVTNKGFLSAVAHRKFDNVFILRARNTEAFDGFFPEDDIVETTSSDYRFRVFVTSGDLNRFMQFCISKIDYDNFKNSIKDKAVHNMATSIWGAAYAFQSKKYGNQDHSNWYETYRESDDTLKSTRGFLDDDFADTDFDDLVLGDEEMGQFQEKYGMSLDSYLDGADFEEDLHYGVDVDDGAYNGTDCVVDLINKYRRGDN